MELQICKSKKEVDVEATDGGWKCVKSTTVTQQISHESVVLVHIATHRPVAVDVVDLHHTFIHNSKYNKLAARVPHVSIDGCFQQRGRSVK